MINLSDTFFFFCPLPRTLCFFIPWGGFLTAFNAGFFCAAAGFFTAAAAGLAAGLVAAGLAAGAAAGLAAAGAAVACFF